MAKGPININALRDKFLFEAGLTLDQIKFTHRIPDSAETEEIELFQGAKFGDMKIFYPTLNGELKHHNGNGKREITYRLRKAVPFLNQKTQKETKYLMTGNICVFFPPEMIKAYREGREIDVLIVTEGEKKAFVACKRGFDCVAISGIWCYKTTDDKENKEQGELLPELKEFLKVCKVKKFVLLHDSDSLDLTDTSKASNKNKAETDRPTNFCNSVKRCAELVFQEGVKFYFAYINPHLAQGSEKLGLDDLILKHETPDQIVLHDFYTAIENGKFGSFFCVYRITHIKQVYFKDIWKLNDPQEFYLYHKKALGGKEKFQFESRIFKINHAEQKVEEEKKIDRELFYVKDGMYYGVDVKGSTKRFSNFTMRVLFLLKSPIEAKRIIAFKHANGHEFVKEFLMDEFTGITNFRKKIFGQGNYMFRGDMFEFNNILESLFADEKAAAEVTRLGWQKKADCFAWSNGISCDGKFFPADEYGIVLFKEKLYYFPAFSILQDDEDDRFENDRNFKHFIESEVSLKDWMVPFLNAYGENGMAGIAFFIASLFRDIIFPIWSYFPLINLFGQKGSGKSTLAKSLMAMFGVAQKPLNIAAGASTNKAIYRKQAQYRNALVWIDEYKNNIDKKAIEMLKSLADGAGYSKAQTSQDDKTTTTLVLSSTIVSGQDMPTIEAALFSRFILLFFPKNGFSQQAKDNYAALIELEKKGLTNITVEFLKYRDIIKQKFKDEYSYWNKKLSADFKNKEVMDRLLVNAAIVMAPISILIDEKVFDNISQEISFTRNDLYVTFINIVERHRTLMLNNEEISVFWGMVEGLVEDGTISADKGHLKHELVDGVSTVIIRFNPIYNAFSIKYRMVNNQSAIDKQTLLNYLENSTAFIEHVKNIRFNSLNPTSGHRFRYADLGVELNHSKLSANQMLTGDGGTEKATQSNTTAAATVTDDDKDLPF